MTDSGGAPPELAELAASICAVLDPVLAPHGFGRGQGGPAGSASVSDGWVVSLTFCADPARMPARAWVLAQQDLAQVHCLDVTLTATPERGLSDVRYEFRPLHDVLDDVGLRDAAERCRQLPTGDAASDIAAVETGLRELLALAQASGPDHAALAIAAAHAWFERNSGWAPPDEGTMEEWLADGICRAPDECLIVPEGWCVHGLASWKLILDALT